VGVKVICPHALHLAPAVSNDKASSQLDFMAQPFLFASLFSLQNQHDWGIDATAVNTNKLATVLKRVNIPKICNTPIAGLKCLRHCSE
jgi:hypothetical protein